MSTTSGSEANRISPSGLFFAIPLVSVLDEELELKLRLSGSNAPGLGGFEDVRRLCVSPETLRLYTLLVSDSLRLRLSFSRFAIESAGEGGTMRTVRSLGLLSGRCGRRGRVGWIASCSALPWRYFSGKYAGSGGNGEFGGGR